MPPCFSAASAILEAASNDNTAAASARRLRIFPSLPRYFRPHGGPIYRTKSWGGVPATSKAPLSTGNSGQNNPKGDFPRQRCGGGAHTTPPTPPHPPPCPPP